MDTACDSFLADQFEVSSDKVTYTPEHIFAEYEYQSTTVENKGGKIKVTPKVDCFEFQTDRKVPKLGIMLVGLGGNNGTTFTAGIIANRKGLTWQTKEREIKANYLGSLTQSSTVRLGNNASGDPVYVPLKNVLPMVEPNDVEVGGWDISSMPLGDAMKKSKVLDVDLQRQLYDDMNKIVPLPSVYFPSFIAANQRDRADHVLKGSKQEQMEQIRKDIRDFKASRGCDKVIVLWTANTERFAEVPSDPPYSPARLLHSPAC
jgi:myo-inositol-1-phosphate synthase